MINFVIAFFISTTAMAMEGKTPPSPLAMKKNYKQLIYQLGEEPAPLLQLHKSARHELLQKPNNIENYMIGGKKSNRLNHYWYLARIFAVLGDEQSEDIELMAKSARKNMADLNSLYEKIEEDCSISLTDELAQYDENTIIFIKKMVKKFKKSKNDLYIKNPVEFRKIVIKDITLFYNLRARLLQELIKLHDEQAEKFRQKYNSLFILSAVPPVLGSCFGLSMFGVGFATAIAPFKIAGLAIGLPCMCAANYCVRCQPLSLATVKDVEMLKLEPCCHEPMLCCATAKDIGSVSEELKSINNLDLQVEDIYNQAISQD